MHPTGLRGSPTASQELRAYIHTNDLVPQSRKFHRDATYATWHIENPLWRVDAHQMEHFLDLLPAWL
jgi:hypothetical protein